MSAFFPVNAVAQPVSLEVPPAERIVVLFLDKQNILTDRQAVKSRLKKTLEDNLNMRVVSDEETFVALDRNVLDMFSSCRGNATCLARLVQNLDARYLLVVSSSKLADSVGLGLRLVDLKKRTTIGQGVHKAKKSADIHREIKEQLPNVVPKTMWQPYGSINLDIATDNVQVFLDGQLIGISPIKKLERIRPGVHEIICVLDGYESQKDTVSVTQGQVTQVTVRLKEKTKRSVPWWVWASVGTVVIGGIVGGIWLGAEREINLCSTPDLSQCP